MNFLKSSILCILEFLFIEHFNLEYGLIQRTSAYFWDCVMGELLLVEQFGDQLEIISVADSARPSHSLLQRRMRGPRQLQLIQIAFRIVRYFLCQAEINHICFGFVTNYQ